MKKILLVGGISILVNILVYLLFVQPDYLVEVRNKEFAALATVIGDDAAHTVADGSRQWFDRMFVQTSIYDQSYALYIPDPNAPRDELSGVGDMIFPHFAKVLDVFWLVVLQMIGRLWILGLWLLPAGVLIFAFMYDGWQQRRRGQTNFSYASAIIETSSLHSIAILIIGMLLLLFAPLTLSPVLPPIALVLVGIVMSMWVRNLQKRL